MGDSTFLPTGFLSKQFLENPFEYFKFIDRLFEKRFSLRQIGIERQEMQYWRANGIINTGESNSDERIWTKVSFFDLCWLRIVDEMRKMGVSIETIKQIKKYFHSIDDDTINYLVEENLKSPIYDQLVKSFGQEEVKKVFEDLPQVFGILKESLSLLILLTINLLDNNAPFFLVIIPGEKPQVLILDERNKHQIDFSDYFLKCRSFYSIYLNPIINGFFENGKVNEDDLQQMFKLSRKEKEIIKLLRKENIKELKIRFDPAKKKGIVMVELIEVKDVNNTEKRLQSLLEKGKFKQIKMQTEGTKIIFIEETTKIKLHNV